jgi:outer membrane protein OmpA-like peptidoglycan-associated protein
MAIDEGEAASHTFLDYPRLSQMVRTCIVIAVMLLAGSAMYFGAAHLPRLLNDLQKMTKDRAPEPDSTPAAPVDDASTRTAKKTDAEVEQAGKEEALATELDVTRISQDGPSVFAGHTAPFQSLTLMVNGKAIATAKADANGDWVLVTEHKFTRADPQISFRIGVQTAQAGTPLPTSVSRNSSEKQPAPTGETWLNPAMEVMKRFEGLVAAAREEAKGRKAKQHGSNGDPGSQPTQASIAEHAVGTPSSTGPQLHAKAETGSTAVVPAVTEPAAPIPVPMTFIYDTATLTSEGHRAGALLLEYLQLKDFGAVTLTGHADERGTHEYNLDLSMQRLDTIERFLSDGGYKGQLDLIPKGETEPFSAVDRTKYRRDDLWQLDRRVELHGAQ